MSVAPDAANGFAARISANDEALDRYRGERAEFLARGASTRTSDRIIARIESESILLQTWVDRDARAAAR